MEDIVIKVSTIIGALMMMLIIFVPIISFIFCTWEDWNKKKK